MTWPAVKEIRAQHAQGIAGRELALRFGITASLVSDIVNERVWRPDTERAAGLALRDRLIGARATCLRQGEMLRVQNRHVYWDQGLIVIPKTQFDTATLRDVLNTKGLKGRVIPFLDDAGHPLDAELLAISRDGRPSVRSPTSGVTGRPGRRSRTSPRLGTSCSCSPTATGRRSNGTAA